MTKMEFKTGLAGIQKELDPLIEAAKHETVRANRPIHPAPGACELTVDVRTPADLEDALNKIHQWIGYLNEITE